ncbi:MAG TPA: hypothetical protein VFN35_10880 [Ktedonobacteraceae bacterium]|nr:hypothetical protein [Ktedonobacteraceae bacterium]
MEQQLALPQKQTKALSRRFALLKQNVLSAFFAVDRSPDNRSVIDLQRRACWIVLAMIFQAINEANAIFLAPNVPFIKPWGGTISFLLILGSFFGLWMAFRPVTLKKQAGRVAGRPYRWQSVILVMALIISIVGVVQFFRSIDIGFLEEPQFTNDGTSLDTNAAILLLEGQNPYTDSDIGAIARRFSILPTWTTPLRLGQFAHLGNTYPSPSDLNSVWATSTKSGAAPEFEAKVSYPSLSFLTLVPFVALGLYNTLSLYFFCYIALVAVGWKVARKELRPWIILLALANVSMWSSVVGGNLDVLAILFVVMAWLWLDRVWLSAILLGLAAACKQPAWFFVLFYAILIYRTYGFKEVVRRLVLIGAVALAFNLPFILWNAQAWFAGVMAPIKDPMFPMGVGIVGLAGSPFLPAYMPSLVYAVLEYAIFYPVCLFWYWRICKSHPEAVMLLAVLPLFFAWRSLSSYFYCAAFPMFILLASRRNTNRGSQPSNLPTLGGPAHQPEEEALSQESETAYPREVLLA